MIYPWHKTVWQALDLSHLPHALLVHGPQGIGKTDFAFTLAQTLLCESRQAHLRQNISTQLENTPTQLDERAKITTDGTQQAAYTHESKSIPSAAQHPNECVQPAAQKSYQACGQCQACNWFAQSNHPDLMIVRPQNLEKENTPVSASEQSKKEKNNSQEIRLEQIHALITFANMGSHRGKHKVILLYPVEMLNIYAANALLKILEEPPSQVIFILLSHNIERVLPTILSRCQQLRLSMPNQQQALLWLQDKGIDNALEVLSYAGGCPLQAFSASQDENNRYIYQFLPEQLGKGKALTDLDLAEGLHKLDLQMVLQGVQRWAYDLLSIRLTQTVRYHPSYKNALQKIAPLVDLLQLLKFLLNLQTQQKYITHPLAPKLLLESTLIEYRRLFNK